MEECCGINLEQEMTIENLYCFIRASLQALQSWWLWGGGFCMSAMWKKGSYKAPEGRAL